MKIKIFLALVTVFAAVNVLISQVNENEKRVIQLKNDGESTKRAKEILDIARKAISPKMDVLKIKAFIFSFDGSFNGGVELKQKTEFSIDLPNKISFFENIDHGTGTASTLQILNGSNSTLKQDSTWGNGTQSRSDFKNIRNPEDDWFKVIKLKTSEAILPFMLEFPFLKTDGFKYIGIAEAETGKADVIETVSTNNKDVYRLLFDQKSHRLLMMVKTFIEDGKSYERNFYFSDYKENSGLMIPHKVTIKGVTSIGSDLFIESNLRVFKINPEFDTKIFEIKDK